MDRFIRFMDKVFNDPYDIPIYPEMSATNNNYNVSNSYNQNSSEFYVQRDYDTEYPSINNSSMATNVGQIINEELDKSMKKIKTKSGKYWIKEKDKEKKKPNYLAKEQERLYEIEQQRLIDLACIMSQDEQKINITENIKFENQWEQNKFNNLAQKKEQYENANLYKRDQHQYEDSHSAYQKLSSTSTNNSNNYYLDRKQTYNSQQNSYMNNDEDMREAIAKSKALDEEKKRLEGIEALKLVETHQMNQNINSEIIKPEKSEAIKEKIITNMKMKKVKEKFKKFLINNLFTENFSNEQISKIKNYFNIYNNEINPNVDQLHIQSNCDNMSTNAISNIVLDLIDILKDESNEYTFKILKHVKSHIEYLEKKCSDYEHMFIFNKQLHQIEESSDFAHHSMEDKFTCVRIKGDGNCLWNSISFSLVGDYSLMESLRLLTAGTLLKYKTEFSKHLNTQKEKFGYSHDLTFEQLVSAATELSVWGDEYHTLALSLALKRPIYSYGSFFMLIGDEDMTYEKLREEYESETIFNHMRYIGNSADKNNIPICIHYNGENHYSAVLPMKAGLLPLIPKMKLLDYVIDESSLRDETSYGYEAEDSKSYKTSDVNLTNSEFFDNRINIYSKDNEEIHISKDCNINSDEITKRELNYYSINDKMPISEGLIDRNIESINENIADIKAKLEEKKRLREIKTKELEEELIREKEKSKALAEKEKEIERLKIENKFKSRKIEDEAKKLTDFKSSHLTKASLNFKHQNSNPDFQSSYDKNLNQTSDEFPLQFQSENSKKSNYLKSIQEKQIEDLKNMKARREVEERQLKETQELVNKRINNFKINSNLPSVDEDSLSKDLAIKRNKIPERYISEDSKNSSEDEPMESEECIDEKNPYILKNYNSLISQRPEHTVNTGIAIGSGSFSNESKTFVSEAMKYRSQINDQRTQYFSSFNDTSNTPAGRKFFMTDGSQLQESNRSYNFCDKCHARLQSINNSLYCLNCYPNSTNR